MKNEPECCNGVPNIVSERQEGVTYGCCGTSYTSTDRCCGGKVLPLESACCGQKGGYSYILYMHMRLKLYPLKNNVNGNIHLQNRRYCQISKENVKKKTQGSAWYCT